MWHLLRVVQNLDSGSKELIQEISQTIARSITLVSVCLFLIWAYLLGAASPGENVSRVILITIPVVVVAWLSIHFLEQYPLASQVLWQVGMIGSVTLALFLFRRPEIAFLYILFPLIAVIIAGWPLALAVEAAVIALVLYIRYYAVSIPAVGNQWAVIIIGSLLVGMIGALATGAMLSVIQRAFRESRVALEQVEEFRRQRMELIQTQDDLLQANRELARLSDRLKALMQIAEDARRVKEEFVANVSHELRTPLNMIIGFSELIAKAPHVYGGLPPALLADIAAIQRNSQHLSDLVNDVLDLSQIEAGRMTLVKDWTSLQELVETAISATKVLFDMKDLYLQADLPVEPIQIFCDRTRLREVLLNLLSNAGRFTDHGGVLVKVAQESDNMIFSVADTGPGISAENQNRIFEPFQQLDNSVRKEGGSGLGLSISKRFVEMHGGKMWLESKMGQGTTFFFSLPVLLPVSRGAEFSGSKRWITPYSQPERDFHRSKAPAPVIVPRYVLLDQSAALGRLFSRNLDDIESVHVQDMENALQELSRSPCQGLIVNGATVGKPLITKNQLNSVPYMTPVITCWLAGGDEEFKKLGVSNYLVKPIIREKLLDAIHSIGDQVHTILLVDDEVEVLQLFARMVNSSGLNYVVLRARNGRQALEILRERKPDVMLIDLVMPDMDGFQVLREKNSDETIRDIPAIIVSSKDPSGAPIISDSLKVVRKGGLSTRELLSCIQRLSETLAPETPTVGQAQRESPPG
jgi:signal transduction histidine kinase/CheY-like chemotaxis protein